MTTTTGSKSPTPSPDVTDTSPPRRLPLLLSIAETRRQLGNASRAALYRLIDQNKLKTAKIGRKRLVFSDSVVELAEESADA